jgi:hypothetical protein
LAAVIRLAQLVLLDHRTHGAIQNQDALGEKLAEFGRAVGLHGSTSVVQRSPGNAMHESERRHKPAEGL